MMEEYLPQTMAAALAAKKYGRLIVHRKTLTSVACAICLESTLKRNVTILPCQHLFHSRCFKQLKDLKCPLCRYKIGPEEEEEEEEDEDENVENFEYDSLLLEELFNYYRRLLHQEEQEQQQEQTFVLYIFVDGTEEEEE